MQAWDDLYSPVKLVRETARAEATSKPFVVGSIARSVIFGECETRAAAEAMATHGGRVYTRDEWDRNLRPYRQS